MPRFARKWNHKQACFPKLLTLHPEPLLDSEGVVWNLDECESVVGWDRIAKTRNENPKSENLTPEARHPSHTGDTTKNRSRDPKLSGAEKPFEKYF